METPMTLSVSGNHHEFDSPGSSVFDLPLRQDFLTHGHTPSGAIDSRINTKILQQEVTHVHDKHSFIVISGGTGGNAICSAFKDASYVLPVSDDGGSSSEIIRVLGGPSIGDVRSRLIRLIPLSPPSSPLSAIRNLLAYRLPAGCIEQKARDEWREIVEGRSKLWSGIPNDRKETIRGFLVHFEGEVLKRAHKNFDFRNGSIGNFFLAAAQGFFRSLPSAIFLFSSITNSHATIYPAVVTNHTVTIAAELLDGERLVGQCEISHPVSHPPATLDITLSFPEFMDGMGGTYVESQNVMFDSSSKATQTSLPSSIKRVLYINAHGMEVHPSPNPDYIESLGTKDVLIYSYPSDMTRVLLHSIVPCLAMRGVAKGIARSPSLRAKILLLNVKNDRETEGYSAMDYIQAICRTLNASYDSQGFGVGKAVTSYPVSAFITDLIYLNGTKVEVDVESITKQGVKCTSIEAEAADSEPKFNATVVGRALDSVLSEFV